MRSARVVDLESNNARFAESVNAIRLKEKEREKEEETWWSQFRNGSNPWMARYMYGLMFLAANLLAWVARDYGHGAQTEINSKPSFSCSAVAYVALNT